MIAAPFFPRLYNTTDTVRALATKILLVDAGITPVYAFIHGAYFTIRSGGKTLITFFFDSCFVWIISVPAAYCLSRFTQVPLLPMIAIVQSLEIIKAIIGGIMVRSFVAAAVAAW